MCHEVLSIHLHLKTKMSDAPLVIELFPFLCLSSDEAAESVHQTSSDHQQQQQQLFGRVHTELTASANGLS